MKKFHEQLRTLREDREQQFTPKIHDYRPSDAAARDSKGHSVKLRNVKSFVPNDEDLLKALKDKARIESFLQSGVST